MVNPTRRRDLPHAAGRATGAYQAPAFEVISLNCEISSYAPDEGDDPLF